MEHQERNSFLAGIKTGLGLTLAARLIGRHPKEVTRLLKEDKELYQEATKAMTEGAQIIMVRGSEYLKDNKLKKFKDNNLYIKNFLDKLVFWEEKCTKEEVTPQKVIEAYATYMERPEVATALGMEEGELMEYMVKKPGINEYLKHYKII